MKIKQIRVVNLDLPKQIPHSKPWRKSAIKSGTQRAFPINFYPEFSSHFGNVPGTNLENLLWVQAIAEDGTYGLGACNFGGPVAWLIDYFYAPLLKHKDVFAIEYLNDLMWRASQFFGSSGISSIAMSGIDLALWDLKGKLLDVPVYSLIGGPCRDKIKLYATSDDLDWAKTLGFKAFKVSNPVHYSMDQEGLNLAEEHISKSRDIVGHNVELMYNPVMSFNSEYALRIAEKLRPYNLRWLEEPLVPTDIDGLSYLKNAITWIPLASGEHHHGRQAFYQLIKNRVVDIVQPDIQWAGGLSEVIKIYHIAESAGISTIPHMGAGTPWGQHFAFSMPESLIAEYWMGSDPGIPLNEICPIPGMATPKDGYIIPSNAPGFGIDIPEKLIRNWDHTKIKNI
ncbi:MAG: hypothetical protein CL758_02445 [Chloroflexi bacterium]|nr:hypothetical protein [Chloroflexota bacterium]|tara:strand:- start:10381 stop:11571 length:1191 start_codon:yes stop_codon:yes gene_type:complete